jgi:hypothetical protein
VAVAVAVALAVGPVLAAAATAGGAGLLAQAINNRVAEHRAVKGAGGLNMAGCDAQKDKARV